MTPDQVKMLSDEAAAWKYRDWKRAMKLLDLDVGGREQLSFADDDNSFVVELRGDSWGCPDALGVAFLKQQARAKLGASVRVCQIADGKWLARLGTPYDSGYFYGIAIRNDAGTAEYPTESHALIAALLAKGK